MTVLVKFKTKVSTYHFFIFVVHLFSSAGTSGKKAVDFFLRVSKGIIFGTFVSLSLFPSYLLLYHYFTILYSETVIMYLTFVLFYFCFFFLSFRVRDGNWNYIWELGYINQHRHSSYCLHYSIYTDFCINYKSNRHIQSAVILQSPIYSSIATHRLQSRDHQSCLHVRQVNRGPDQFRQDSMADKKQRNQAFWLVSGSSLIEIQLTGTDQGPGLLCTCLVCT